MCLSKLTRKYTSLNMRLTHCLILSTWVNKEYSVFCEPNEQKSVTAEQELKFDIRWW